MRRARVRTRHDDDATARRVAAALTPDNTDEMETAVADGTVTTTVRRESTGSLQATVDDYVVSLQVATRLATEQSDRQDTQRQTDDNTQT